MSPSQERWRLSRVQYPDDPALNYAVDLAIAEHVARGAAPPTVRLWQPGRCLAIGRFDSRLPHFPEAVRHMKAQGLTLAQRMSGGKAVWQSEGFLNFSVIAPKKAAPMGIAEAYRKFSEGLRLGLRTLGVETSFQHIKGAFCDGPYDLAVADKKLVGTAQVQKRGFIIVHGTMPVDGALDEMIEKISEFYERAGQPIRLRKETMTTLAAELGRPLPIEKLIEVLCEGFQSSLGHLSGRELLKSEWQRAHKWLEEVKL